MQGAALFITCGLLLTSHAVHTATAGAPAAPSKDAAGATAQLQADKYGLISPEVENMLKWMEDNGGEVNVVVRTLPNKGRKVYASQDFAAGDVLAEIPLDICYEVRPVDPAVVQQRLQNCKEAKEYDMEWAASAERLLQDMHDPSSPYQPYFAVLPGRDAVWSWFDLPDSYLPLIQNKALEASIARWAESHFSCHNSSNGNSGQLQPPLTASVDDLRYASSLMGTRFFAPQDGGSYLLMLPLLDMADHWNGCPHTYQAGPCSSTQAGNGQEGGKRCVIWNAGDSVAAGAEVCNGYKFLLQDMSLLSYGFLQEGPVVHQLSRIDRHDFDPKRPWLIPEAVEAQGAPFQAVAPDQTRAELERLKQLLADLEATDTQLKPHIKPHRRDPSGWILQQLWLWREQRQAAVAAEMARLKLQLERLEEAYRVYEQPKPQVVYDRLLAWKRENGAVVNVAITTPNNSPTTTSACTAHAHATAAAEVQAPAVACAEASGSGGNQQQQASKPAVVAARAVASGEELAVIPVALAYPVEGGSFSSIEEAALQVLLDMHKLTSTRSSSSSSTARTSQPASEADVGRQAAFWEPFYATLPPFGSSKTLHNFPAAYLPLLQHAELENFVREAAKQVELSWHQRLQSAADAASNSSLTLEELKHMVAVVNSRLQVLGSAGLGMVPLLDLATHDNACPHTIELQPCQTPHNTAAAAATATNDHTAAAGSKGGSCSSHAGSADMCIFWRAGADVAPGQEVCSRHRGYLTPDVALLLHGMVLPEPQQQQQGGALFAIDSYGVDLQELLGSPGVTHEKPETLEGTHDTAVGELASLKALLKHLSAEPPLVTGALNPVAEDWGGKLLQQLRAWRLQRIAAVSAEINRIADVVAKLDGAAVNGVAPELAKLAATASLSAS